MYLGSALCFIQINKIEHSMNNNPPQSSHQTGIPAHLPHTAADARKHFSRSCEHSVGMCVRIVSLWLEKREHLGLEFEVMRQNQTRIESMLCQVNAYAAGALAGASFLQQTISSSSLLVCFACSTQTYFPIPPPPILHTALVKVSSTCKNLTSAVPPYNTCNYSSPPVPPLQPTPACIPHHLDHQSTPLFLQDHSHFFCTTSCNPPATRSFHNFTPPVPPFHPTPTCAPHHLSHCAERPFLSCWVSALSPPRMPGAAAAWRTCPSPARTPSSSSLCSQWHSAGWGC